MKLFTPPRLWSVVLGLPLACGSADRDVYEASPRGVTGFEEAIDAPRDAAGTLRAGLDPTTFPGGGTSGAALPLSPALAPESSGDCDPRPAAGTPAPSPDVQTVCFYGPGALDVPAATIQQVVEVVGNAEWVHIRLTLNPDFVDNTYGEAAVGWTRERDVSGVAPGEAAPPDAPEPPDARAAADGDPGPTPPDADAGAPRERPTAPPRAQRPRPGVRGGHTFKDLLGSDHAELQLLDATGEVAMHFKLDYVSESVTAPSGFASLGVSDGEGELIVGQAEWVLASTTSIDRNLNACGLASFTESSPATDTAYTPSSSASDWDYRVAYEIWVSTEAFGAVGFGSALIENVHASPSKAEGNTVTVLPAPCPSDPTQPEAAPEPVPAVLQNIR